jgi:hypothetical protein
MSESDTIDLFELKSVIQEAERQVGPSSSAFQADTMLILNNLEEANICNRELVRRIQTRHQRVIVAFENRFFMEDNRKRMQEDAKQAIQREFLVSVPTHISASAWVSKVARKLWVCLDFPSESVDEWSVADLLRWARLVQTPMYQIEDVHDCSDAPRLLHRILSENYGHSVSHPKLLFEALCESCRRERTHWHTSPFNDHRRGISSYMLSHHPRGSNATANSAQQSHRQSNLLPFAPNQPVELGFNGQLQRSSGLHQPEHRHVPKQVLGASSPSSNLPPNGTSRDSSHTFTPRFNLKILFDPQSIGNGTAMDEEKSRSGVNSKMTILTSPSKTFAAEGGSHGPFEMSKITKETVDVTGTLKGDTLDGGDDDGGGTQFLSFDEHCPHDYYDDEEDEEYFDLTEDENDDGGSEEDCEPSEDSTSKTSRTSDPSFSSLQSHSTHSIISDLPLNIDPRHNNHPSIHQPRQSHDHGLIRADLDDTESIKAWVSARNIDPLMIDDPSSNAYSLDTSFYRAEMLPIESLLAENPLPDQISSFGHHNDAFPNNVSFALGKFESNNRLTHDHMSEEVDQRHSTPRKRQKFESPERVDSNGQEIPHRLATGAPSSSSICVPIRFATSASGSDCGDVARSTSNNRPSTTPAVQQNQGAWQGGQFQFA